LLSDVVAAEVVRIRRAAGLTRDDLAERCARRGLPLTTSTIANIETGRRDGDGRRRREVTVDELVVLADALKVAPVLLVFPVGQQGVTTWVGESGSVDTWLAAQWFGGHGEHPIADISSGSDTTIEVDGRTIPVREVTRVYRLPIRLYSDYEQAQRRLWMARAKLSTLRRRAKTGGDDVIEMIGWTESTIKETEELLQSYAQRMVDEGLEVPTNRQSAWVEPEPQS
jgi:transcriptional regulator with XRE-family HTH domain